MMTWLNVVEWIASLLGVVSVWLIVRRNVWGFPIGIVMVSLYILVFYQQKFYSDMLLQVAYIGLQLHGWYQWTRGDHDASEKIIPLRLTSQQVLLSGAAVLVGTVVLGYSMSRLTDAALPWVDALTTSLSLTAQVMMNKRYLENWALWIVADVIYLYQYGVKGLYATTGLYFVFLIMAIIGHREWRMHERNAASSAHL